MFNLYAYVKLSLFDIYISGELMKNLYYLVASRSADDRFFGGPRFGRSGTGGVIFGSGELDARNPERFFIGSRYGKRSELERESDIILNYCFFLFPLF